MPTRFLFLTSILLTGIAAFEQDVTRQGADSMLTALKKSKQDTGRIGLLLNLAQFHIFKPGELKTDLDSAMVYIKEAEALNKYAKSSDGQGYLFLTQSYLMREKGEKEEGKKLAGEAISVLEHGKNKLYLGRAYYELSQYYNYYEQPEIVKKIALVEQSLDAFRQAGDRQLAGASLTTLGDLYCRKQDYPTAIGFLNQALAVYDTIKYARLQEVYVVLGQSYRGLRDESHGLSYFLKALKTAKIFHDTTMQVCQINNSLARIYSSIDNKEMAIRYWNEGLEIAKKYKDEYTILLLSTNLSTTYNDLVQPGKALDILRSVSKSFQKTEDTYDKCLYISAYFRTYLNFKQYTRAAPYRDSLVKLFDDSLLDNQSRSSICWLLTTYYLEKKQYAKARHYLNENLAIAKEMNYETAFIQGSRLWYKLDSIEGNYQSAFKHLRFFKAKMDSIYAVNRIKQLQVLSVEYETEMKEDSIKLQDKDISLLIQENSLQQANLKQAGLTRNITIAGIIFSFIIIGLLYRQYRRKQKNNTIISTKNEMLQHLVNEKDWLVKEIHHRVKNNLQTVMGLLGTQSGYLKNDEAITAITDSQHRIQAMSLIHQRLYQSNNLSAIKMTDYIHELADSLSDSFNTGNHILFNLDIEPIELDLAHCIPLGLILNEAITNSFKYAFRDDKQGVISIALRTTSENNFLLSINDNGKGLPPGFNVNRSDSMGMNLMRGLSQELGAQFIISVENGTRIDIRFVYYPDITDEITQTITETAYPT